MTDLTERLRGPVQWGYMCLTDGGFIADDTPFEAATTLETLTQENARLREALEFIDGQCTKMRGGTDDWFDLVEFQMFARKALGGGDE